MAIHTIILNKGPKGLLADQVLLTVQAGGQDQNDSSRELSHQKHPGVSRFARQIDRPGGD